MTGHVAAVPTDYAMPALQTKMFLTVGVRQRP
jgi:hypothetical protein